jgi:hypothetical protein
VSVQELKESDKKKKLKVVSLLHGILASRDKISLRNLLAANENDEAGGENTDVASFVEALLLCDDVAISLYCIVVFLIKCHLSVFIHIIT